MLINWHWSYTCKNEAVINLCFWLVQCNSSQSFLRSQMITRALLAWWANFVTTADCDIHSWTHSQQCRCTLCASRLHTSSDTSNGGATWRTLMKNYHQNHSPDCCTLRCSHCPSLYGCCSFYTIRCNRNLNWLPIGHLSQINHRIYKAW